jgi:hypothetical protein
MSFIAISLALLFLFDIALSLGFVIIAWPIARRTVGVDLSIYRLIAEVLSPIIVVGATIDVLRLHRLTSALFDVKPPPLFMGVLAGESARMLAESARLGSVLLPW